jgi:2-dehydro-3-deoxygalactonokinase
MTMLIGVDWGSTSARAFAIGPDGAIVEARRAGDGVLARGGDFATRLDALLGDWRERFAAAPILMCGMIGSDRGWVPAPYVPAPAGLDDVARHLVAAPFARPAWIVPGVSFEAGATAEVMRGEETLLAGLGLSRALVCLPGTHSKWVDVADGRIAGFRTYMTGELRALLLAQGALATGIAQTDCDDAFRAGVDAARVGATRALFQARARRLLGRLAPEHTAAFVSGVLIGEEVAREAGRSREVADGAVALIAGGALAAHYGTALRGAGLTVAEHEPEPLAARGLLTIARRAGLL